MAGTPVVGGRPIPWLYAFCAALDADRGLPCDVRPLVHQLMDAFWCRPTRAEAVAWGAYSYDSDPAGTAIRPLARPFAAQGQVTRGDRAWSAGSLALSTPRAREAYLNHAPERELAGAPETELRIRIENTEVTSQLIAAGGGFRACTTLSSAAELVRITGPAGFGHAPRDRVRSLLLRGINLGDLPIRH